MPVTYNDSYSAPFLLKGKHVETIYPALLRSVSQMPSCERHAVTLDDGDELFYDHYKVSSDKVVIISHGLEGSSVKPYVKGMAKAMVRNGYDVIAWNFRSCHGGMNKTQRFYHSGATEDLDVIADIANKQYKEVYLVGFSLGANLILKYAGETISQKHNQIKKFAAICAPLDLKKGSISIGKMSNIVYAKRFLLSLKNKIKIKEKLMPGKMDIKSLPKVKTLYDFDDFFTAPLHGFKDADDYYEQCSSINFIDNISKPTLVLNALNDPMLPEETFDISKFNSLKSVTLELTKSGGHCGFPYSDKDGYYWSEKRILQFFND